MHLAAPCWVMSDAHIGAAPPQAERDLLAWLDAARTAARSVVINGDMFEFWFEWRHVIPRTGYRAVAALASLREAGVEVLFVGGNHDCWGGEALIADTGITYHMGSWEGTIGPWRTFIDHGDGLRDLEDRRYRMVRPLLRHPLSRWAYRLVHPDVGVWLAKATSHTSRNTRPRDGGEGLRRIGTGILEQRADLDVVIFGHSHVSALQPAGRGVFANPGAWLDAPTYLHISDTRVELRRWNRSVDGDLLDAFDRASEKALPQP